MSEKLKRMTELAKRIDENTALPLKIVVAMMTLAVTMSWGFAMYMSGMKRDQTQQAVEIKEQIKDVNRKLDGIWTVGSMQLWAERMKGENPGLKVPDVGAVVRETVALRTRRENE